MFNIKNRFNKFWIFTFLICFEIVGCKKFVELEPPVDSLTTLSAFSNDNTAISVMTGNLTVLSSSNNFSAFISKNTGLSSDELTLWNGASDGDLIAYYTNELFSDVSGSAGDEYWPYIEVYSCNTVIEGVLNSKNLTELVKNQLIGEAKFLRAFYFFYLVNLYGDIPMPLTTDVRVNAQLGRTSKDKVYQQIISDLKEAESLLSADFLDGGLHKYISVAERVRPTKWAVLALLARTYLYTQDYANAEITASEVINNTGLFSLTSLNDVFKSNSREAIWQLQPIQTDMNTGEGAFFILTSAGLSEYNPVHLSDTQLSSFEPGDLRGVDGNWINSVDVSGTTYHYAYKYKLGYGTTFGSEYFMIFRLGEQYLIRAEARAKLGNVSGAKDDLFAIRRRAGLTDNSLTANDQTSLLTAILHERQVELFTEWGHRWLDLKRTGNIEAVMNAEAPRKGGNWQTTDELYPLPFYDIQRNRNLTQNPGY